MHTHTHTLAISANAALFCMRVMSNEKQWYTNNMDYSFLFTEPPEMDKNTGML